jgi:hypothetical protein
MWKAPLVISYSGKHIWAASERRARLLFFIIEHGVRAVLPRELELELQPPSYAADLRQHHPTTPTATDRHIRNTPRRGAQRVRSVAAA